jgi:hypothetical protein
MRKAQTFDLAAQEQDRLLQMLIAIKKRDQTIGNRTQADKDKRTKIELDQGTGSEELKNIRSSTRG